MPESTDVSSQPQPPRPSRQELVVPQRQSGWPLAAGGIASAAVGFGLVLFLGIGRGRPTAAPTQSSVAETEQAVDPTPERLTRQNNLNEPRPLPAAESATVAPPVDRWAPRGEGRQLPDAAEPFDRYATKPVSHDEAEDSPASGPDPAVAPGSLSRFSSPDLPPPSAEAAAESLNSQEAADPSELPPVDVEQLLEPAPDTSPAPAPAAAEVAAPAAAVVKTEADVVDEPGQPANEPANTEPDTSAFLEPLAEPTSDENPATLSEPLEIEEDAGHVLAVSDSAALDTAPLATPAANEPLPLDEGESHDALPLPIAGSSVEGSFPPAAAAVPVGLPLPPPSPFAAAPPLSPPAGTLDRGTQPAEPPAGEGLPSQAAGLEGQGMPGPLQLEGVQTPQLAVEKRGPKEIQVGQPARYEILVRNVGSATAHEVTLRDEVPRGTSLIATTPPAMPASHEAAAAELVWLLGVLPPGGEARVLMELMPEMEGEVGSIASVSFRADATLRSRATRPDLAIECPPPEPVRIGGNVQVALTISNPGSGTATGVVLEAFLPETVSHRAGGELEFDVGQLRPGESKTIELVLGTRSPGQQPARFVARADGGIEIDQPLPIPVTAPTLEVAIDMPARRFLQRPATCKISMVNAGTASARSVELAAQIPPGMKFVRANNAGWHDERTHRVLWNLEELPPGDEGIVEVVVMPIQPGEQRITAAARSTDGPSDQAMHVCQVEGLAALAFHVADSEDPIEVEGITEYVVRVTNEGTKAASGVRLAANLLGDLEPVEAEGPSRHRVENRAIDFEPLAKLAPGEEVVYRIRARGRRAGHQRVQVQLMSDDHPTPITKEEVTSVYDDR
jgi:uncharacterized repeat protein (TIGR01451 family)